MTSPVRPAAYPATGDGMMPDLVTHAKVVELAAYRAAHPRAEPRGIREVCQPTVPRAQEIDHRRRMLRHLTEQVEKTQASR